MRKKDELAIDKIIECAKKEFFDKGFEESSMRNIAENAGYTTGMLYGRFSDKDALFKTIVKDAADKLFFYYKYVQEEFAKFEPKVQYNDMHIYVDERVDEMLNIVYDNFEEFKLIICKSKGSEYENYIDKLIEIETDNTVRFINELNAAGFKVNEVRADLSHMLATAMFNGMFEVIEHDFTKEDARQYIKQLQYFFNAGWDKLLGLPDNWSLQIKNK